MSEILSLNAQTRMLFLGEQALADGFRLIGFETHPDPTPEEVDKRLRELQRERARAYVIVDDDLMRADIPGLQQVRREGGRIVVISVPRLQADPRLYSDVAARLSAMFGGSNLQQ
ncbi:hypothetical protein Thiowin_04652 [Thiorhodovibrio winogradskyi]|uniref:ATPase n=1 Tax=Thiorhodovibrio winogradskyi TaxID=77007 RepID=A0ABZ0SES0_9GAMM|nr:V-type ATP synthase subunit F [Thiorhodovibrio winogradskyi]